MADEKKEETVAAPAQASPEQEELKKKEEHRANLEKAIAEAEETLREKRKLIKTVVVEDDTPKIDDTDPSARAWNRRITESIAPVTSDLEKQKTEVRTFALREFLTDKPALANNPEKLRELMSMYDRLKVATEQTKEGVLIDLDKAYGATFHSELRAAAKNARIDAAKEAMIESDVAVTRGSSAEAAARPEKRQYTAEERKIIEGFELHGAPKID